MLEEASPLTKGDSSPGTGRLYYLDWLRVIAILFVFFHHCAKCFDYHTFTVYNEVRSLGMSAFREFNFLWMMPLFFVISGASVYFSLKTRKVKGFVLERILRILVPVAILGTFVINPPQVYVERLLKGQTDLGFFQWYPDYFNGIYLAGGNFAPLGTGTHLWYLEYLFFYTLILLPLFVRGGKTGRSLLTRLSGLLERPWALFLLFIPLSLASAAFEAAGLGFLRLAGGWDPISYVLFFIYGYLIISNQRIQETVVKYGPFSLAAAIILTLLYLDSHFGVNLVIPGVTRHDMLHNGAGLPLDQNGWTAVQALRGLLGWLWIIGLMGMGRRLLNFTTRRLPYLNQAVLPFYIMHQTVIVVVSYFFIRQGAGIAVNFWLTAVISFGVIMALYELLVRRFNIPRFLFGLKLFKKQGRPAR